MNFAAPGIGEVRFDASLTERAHRGAEVDRADVRALRAVFGSATAGFIELGVHGDF
ncbi:hypothetical protein ACQKRQ_28305 [Paraburkholderia sp. NPDC080076]|uniref:hypothetical protein n=1 Tax=Paraburkholderia sp. NPDC080076 TaxID=3390605 RepID=UPI003CFC1157